MWEQTIRAIAACRGVVIVIGGPQTGKTTFARSLYSAMATAGNSAALADCDPSHSDLCPPTCIGLFMPGVPDQPLWAPHSTALAGTGSRFSPPFSSAPSHFTFVGASTVLGYIPEFLGAVGRLVALCGDHRPLILDMPGAIHGTAARRLYHALFDLVTPEHVVALQHNSELAAILAPLRGRMGVTVHLPGISAEAEALPAEFRVQRRTMRFAALFSDPATQMHTFDFNSVAFTGTWLGCGAPIEPHMHRYLWGALADYTHLHYAESYGTHLGIMISRALPDECPALDIALEQFGAREVSVSRAPNLKNLLVGLETNAGKLLALGRIEAISFKRRTLGVRCSLRTASAVRLIRFGAIRLADDGEVMATMLPGEL